MRQFRFFQLPTHEDAKGALTVAELTEHLHWTPKRLYWITRSDIPRGLHAHRQEQELFLCVQGTLRARVHDGQRWHEFTMQGPRDALHVGNMVWHEFDSFSPDAILLAASSIPFDGKKGYISDFKKFLQAI